MTDDNLHHRVHDLTADRDLDGDDTFERNPRRKLFKLLPGNPPVKGKRKQTCGTTAKVKYDSRPEAAEVARHMKAVGRANDDTLTEYLCPHCDFWHVGHQRWKKQEGYGE